MLSIWFTQLESEPLPSRQYEGYLRELPQEMADKIRRFRRWQDAHLSLFGKLLLIHGLQQLNLPPSLLGQMKYSEYQRPELPLPHLDFNITHSGPLVACAIAQDRKIGIDVEDPRSIDFEDFRNIWRPDEWAQIMDPDMGKANFYHLWTCKEAVIKADGKGMSIPLKDIRIGNKEAWVNEEHWFLKKVRLNDSIPCHLASDKDFSEDILIRELSYY